MIRVLSSFKHQTCGGIKRGMFIGHPFYVSINCESIITKQWNETRISTRRGIGWVEWLAWQKNNNKKRITFYSNVK
jgi:hypothetical protein